VLPSKVINHPECALFYVRTVVEMHLHMLMAEEYRDLARQLPIVVAYMKQCSVANGYQREKEELIAYAEEILIRVKILLKDY
jgi:hypothetical protein